MKASVIVTNYKTPDALKLCLSSLFSQEAPFQFEILVADIEAAFEDRQLMQDAFPRIRYIPIETNCGFAKAVNTALREAQGEYIVVANADIVLAENTGLARLIEYISQHQEIGICAPALLNFDGTPQQSYFRFYTPLTIAARRTFIGSFSFAQKALDSFLMRDIVPGGVANEPLSVDWLMGAALVFQKDFFKKIGVLDEQFFMYFEDVDIARRARDAGLKVMYYPLVKAFHYHQKASASKRGVLDILLKKYTRVHLTSAVKYYLKHGIK